MDVVDYVAGAYASARVDDLILHGAGDVELLFILESPHTSELKARHPLAGVAGRDALAYLLDQPRGGESLGALVKKNIDNGDPRIAILNVSPVPLQEKAFKRTSTVVAPALADWSPLVELRDTYTKSATKALSGAAQAVADRLLTNLQTRVSGAPIGAGCHIAICGGIARRFGTATVFPPSRPVLEVRHPSNHWWQEGVG